MFNRKYGWEPPAVQYAGGRPWVAECSGPCSWVTFHRSWRQAFGYAVRHICNPLGFQ